MIRLKQKKEAEKRAKEEEAAEMAAAQAEAKDGDSKMPDVAEGKGEAKEDKAGQVKIFGFGRGKKSGSKKGRKTPGELRIQKGDSRVSNFPLS
jgi:hypothetical protein